ncbi:hypothetical protein UB45_21395, partial [Terrabacter sp. 28]
MTGAFDAAAGAGSTPTRRTLLRATAATGAALGLAAVARPAAARADRHASPAGTGLHARGNQVTVVLAHGA